MKYNELIAGRQTKTSRVGRGISAGRGKTAGRGTKGQGSRKSPVRAGFEGGQTPIYMRLPKLRGFKTKRTAQETVKVGELQAVKKVTIDTNSLYEAGLISSPHTSVKLIAGGELSAKKTVRLQAASASAIETVEKAGGTFERVERLARQSKKNSDTK